MALRKSFNVNDLIFQTVEDGSKARRFTLENWNVQPQTPIAMSWELVKEYYQQNGLALFLGAGVSIGSRIPSWPGLISQMMEDLCAETGGRDAFRELQNAGFSLPSITEFVERKVGESRFLSTLRACLYKDFPCRDIQQTFDPAAAKRIVEHIRNQNPTLESVYNLAVTEKNNRLEANPRIHCIVNFNLDSLMEAYDSARNAIKGAPDVLRCLRTS